MIQRSGFEAITGIFENQKGVPYVLGAVDEAGWSSDPGAVVSYLNGRLGDGLCNVYA
jgi:hypothetical protein